MLEMNSGGFDTDIDVRHIAPTVCRLLGTSAPDECEVDFIPEVVKSLSSRPRIALIVIDAVGLSTIKLHRENAPFLMRAIDEHFLALSSVFPPITPVNFASMATGVSPVMHSIRNREETVIQDTLFDSLRRGGRMSCVCARENSTLNLLLSSKADERAISRRNKDTEIVLEAEAMFERCIPDFCWVQLLDMDDAQHKFGVINPSAGKALAKLDENLKHLCEILQELEYGIIICADHGQHDGKDNTGGIHDGTSSEDVEIPLTWME